MVVKVNKMLHQCEAKHEAHKDQDPQLGYGIHLTSSGKRREGQLANITARWSNTPQL
jgi:hypothetical protein